jgi:uncharacterized protein
MKYALVLMVVLAGAWLLLSRTRKASKGNNNHARRKDSQGTAAASSAGSAGAGAVQTVVACAHCAVHLPKAEALNDAQGHWFCDSAHRLAGPRQQPPGA